MLVGYKLIRNSDQFEVQTWGGAWGSFPSVPNPLFLPNGDHVHAPVVGGSYGGYTLVAWEMELVVSVADAKATRIAEAWSEQKSRFSEASVNVTVGGVLRPYGCDATTRENIVAIVGAIMALPAAIPNPRAFTPKGASTPVATTHEEFKAIYIAGLAKGDEFYAAYLAHKAAISALVTVEDVQSYNLTVGWPA